MSKKIFISILLIAAFSIGCFIIVNTNIDSRADANELPDSTIIKVAACPTCFDLAKNIQAEKYEIIKTGSTAESLVLLQNNTVDLVLAGRTLKPHEPQMDSLLIKQGYSFLSSSNATIFIDQLKNYKIYTDLDEEELKQNFNIEKIQTVDNVYEYLDEGIIITSWENTDYTKAAIVHVLENNNRRVRLSRRPTVYCPNVCEEQAQELVLYLK